MPIIIDTNCLANVFSAKSDRHEHFKPVKEWIISGKGLVVYGGTQYFEELKKNMKYAKILRLLKASGKAKVGDRTKIDELTKRNKAIFPEKDFDDPHLPAIAIVTKCLLICSEDMRSVKYIKNRQLYPSGFSVPVYYSSEKNANLLCDKYVHADNKPLLKINKAIQKKIYKNLKP
ncbi:MAG: hypothetical protein ACPG5B_01520 [Chitinophagales bacterium]